MGLLLVSLNKGKVFDIVMLEEQHTIWQTIIPAVSNYIGNT